MVALTKVDLVDPRPTRRGRRRRSARCSRRPGCATRRSSPVSARDRRGHRRARAPSSPPPSATTAARRPTGLLRLPVDRAFTLAGAGTVVTGTLVSGSVAVGDHVVVSPVRPRRARPRHPRPERRGRRAAVAGQRCALNLAGDGVTSEAIAPRRRGARPGAARARPTASTPSSACSPPRRSRSAAGTPVRLHTGAAEVGVRVVPLGRAARAGRDRLRPARPRRAGRGGGPRPLRAPRRLGAADDRRRPSSSTCAPRPAGAATPERLALLAAAREPDPARARRRPPRRPARLPRPRRLRPRPRPRPTPRPPPPSPAAGAAAVGGVAIAAERLGGLRGRARGTLAAFHAENPDLAGHRPRAAAAGAASRGCRGRPSLAFLRREARGGPGGARRRLRAPARRTRSG